MCGIIRISTAYLLTSLELQIGSVKQERPKLVHIRETGCRRSCSGISPQQNMSRCLNLKNNLFEVWTHFSKHQMTHCKTFRMQTSTQFSVQRCAMVCRFLMPSGEDSVLLGLCLFLVILHQIPVTKYTKSKSDMKLRDHVSFDSYHFFA